MAAPKPKRYSRIRNRASEIERAILSLLAERAAESTICPSEVARLVARGNGEDWRTLMPRVRTIAVGMARASAIFITRKGQELNQLALGLGPIRLGRGRQFPR